MSIYLDTHVVAWLYSGLTDKLTDLAKTLINDNEVYISAIVRLELQYLYEIKRQHNNINISLYFVYACNFLHNK